MSAVPELKDEINRKALETAQHLILSIHRGNITPHQFSIGIDALWMAVSGLVHEDIVDLITAAGNEAPTRPAVEKRTFLNANTIKVVSREVGGDTITLRTFVDGVETTGTRRDMGSAASARDALIHVASKLLTEGFFEL